jgi:arginyl-tRNA synthetase
MEEELEFHAWQDVQTIGPFTVRTAPMVHPVPAYAIRVADDFHRFYHEHRVVGSETETFRLALVRATQSVIARALDLVGVDAPDRM